MILKMSPLLCTQRRSGRTSLTTGKEFPLQLKKEKAASEAGSGEKEESLGSMENSLLTLRDLGQVM